MRVQLQIFRAQVLVVMCRILMFCPSRILPSSYVSYSKVGNTAMRRGHRSEAGGRSQIRVIFGFILNSGTAACVGRKPLACALTTWNPAGPDRSSFNVSSRLVTSRPKLASPQHCLFWTAGHQSMFLHQSTHYQTLRSSFFVL
jgi:hypothetical protein